MKYVPPLFSSCFSFFLFHRWGLNVFIGFFCTFLMCFFYYFLDFTCKHFVKMYILGKLLLYTIGMLYKALMFKLCVCCIFLTA